MDGWGLIPIERWRCRVVVNGAIAAPHRRKGKGARVVKLIGFCVLRGQRETGILTIAVFRRWASGARHAMGGTVPPSFGRSNRALQWAKSVETSVKGCRATSVPSLNWTSPIVLFGFDQRGKVFGVGYSSRWRFPVGKASLTRVTIRVWSGLGQQPTRSMWATCRGKHQGCRWAKRKDFGQGGVGRSGPRGEKRVGAGWAGSRSFEDSAQH
jgi:hypothetical protein